MAAELRERNEILQKKLEAAAAMEKDMNVSARIFFLNKNKTCMHNMIRFITRLYLKINPRKI